MSIQICPICDYKIEDGAAIVAIVTSTFVAIPSEVSYAITPPTKCIEIVHNDCYDWEDHEADDGEIRE